MATKQWESLKRQYCDKAGCQVALQAQIIYPIDYLPDNPRILSERCSHGDLCLKERLGSCAYSGGDPKFDPFSEQHQSKKLNQDPDQGLSYFPVIDSTR